MASPHTQLDSLRSHQGRQEWGFLYCEAANGDHVNITHSRITLTHTVGWRDPEEKHMRIVASSFHTKLSWPQEIIFG